MKILVIIYFHLTAHSMFSPNDGAQKFVSTFCSDFKYNPFERSAKPKS